MFLPYTLRLWERREGAQNESDRSPARSPIQPSGSRARAGAPQLPSLCSAPGKSRFGGFAYINSALFRLFSFFFFLFFPSPELLLLASGRKGAFNAGGLGAGCGRSAVGVERPAGYWAIGLATAGRANPSAPAAGPPSKDGCQTLRSSAKKTNKGTFKNSRVKQRGFFFFFLPFSVLHKLSSLAVNDLFPFVARGNCRWCGFQESFPLSWMWSRRWIHFPSDAAGSLLPSRASGRNLCRLH